MEDFVGGELPLAKLRRWSALDELDPPGSLLPNEGSHAQAKVFAAIWEGKGGLPAALPVLHSGLPQEDACFAAMVLGALVDDRAAPQVDEDKQILRALLQVHDFPFVKPETSMALSFTMQRLAEMCPSMPAQIVAACNDPDARMASLAIACARRLVAADATRQVMLDAGVLGGIVRALSHTSQYCRSSACFFTHLAKHSPELLQQMLDAGIVPALVMAMGEGPYLSREDQNRAPAESEPLFGGIPDLPVAQPALCAFFVLVNLVRCKESIVHEVARTPRPGGAIMELLRGFRGGQRRFAVKLLCRLMDFVAQQPDRPSKKRRTLREAICHDLMREGLPEVLPELIGPTGPDHSENMLLVVDAVLNTLGHGCFPRESQQAVAAALIRHIEDGSSDAFRGDATRALSKMTHTAGPARELFTSGTLSDKLVRQVAGVMVKGSVQDAYYGMRMLVDRLSSGSDADAVFSVAASGGFILGIFRLVREPQPILLASLGLQLDEGIALIAKFGNDRHMAQAIKVGLLDRVRALFQAGTTADLRYALAVCKGLLRFPSALEEARKVGLLPNILRDVAASEAPDLGSELAEGLEGCSKINPTFVKEAMEAGLLSKLKKARDKAKKGSWQQLKLTRLIKSFDALLRLGPEEIEAQQRLADLGGPSGLSGDENNPEHSQLVEVGQSRSSRHGSSLKSTPAAIEGATPTSDLPSCAPEVRSAARESSRESGLSGDPVQLERGLAASSDDAANVAEEPCAQARPERRAGRGAAPRRQEESPGCAMCGRRGGGGLRMNKCGRCMTVLYCGRDCQQQHWPQHKKECRAKQAN